MENEKDLEAGATPVKKEEHADGNSSRARNRTVMLTPEITSQVRSRLAQELDTGYPTGSTHRERGPQAEVSSGGFYSPAVATRAANDHAHAHSNGPTTAQPPLSQEEGVVWVKESPVVGFLIGFDVNPNGAVYELRNGRLMVTSQATPGESSLVIHDTSVSPMHAILRIAQSGEIQVLDQLSEFGTKIKRFGSKDEQLLSGEKSTLEHGDIVTFGNRSFTVCIIPRSSEG